MIYFQESVSASSARSFQFAQKPGTLIITFPLGGFYD